MRTWKQRNPAARRRRAMLPAGRILRLLQLSIAQWLQAKPVAENANYGGQAVLEGVMIRGPKAMAVAVRRLDGRIVLKKESLLPLTRRHRLLNIPLLRGAFALADAMLTGLRALSFSADVAMEEENERLAAEAGTNQANRPTDAVDPPAAAEAAAPTVASPADGIEEREVKSGQGLPLGHLIGTLAAAGAIVVLVFVMFPDAVANLLRGHLPAGGGSNVLINLIEGLIRVGLFVCYILAISRMDAIRRVFQYHGAEHQTIYAFENGDPVTPAAAARYDTAHPRCGTSFIAVVVVVSILAFSLLDVHVWYVRQAAKLALLPVIAGVSYEVIRLAGAGRFQFLVTPGLWLQRLTTRRPDGDQVEVAIAALQGALEQEGRSLNRAEEAARD